MENKFEKYTSYATALESALKNEEIEISNDKLIDLVKAVIDEDSLVSGPDYMLPSQFYIMSATKYIANKVIYDKEIKNKLLGHEHRLLVIVESIEEKLRLNLPKKCITKIIYVKNNENKSFVINIDSRLNSMMLEPATKKKVYPKGQIFVARLYDIVRMYNEMGDSLFEKNVRFSLESDKNDVETSIHSTLENEPYYFWFYNNGITLLADKVNYSDSKSIEIFAVDGNKFSVINGAQTITACADFYYSPFIDEEKIDKAKSAYVMLRIISVYEDKDAQDLDCEEEVEGASRKGAKERLESKISVSLNRQKPIDEEDLAINSETVYMINNIEVDEHIKINISRKGEEQKKNTYYLIDVARYVMATKLQKPGAAKNTYRGYILKMEGDRFKKKEILPKFRNIEMIEQEYLNQYGLVNLANILYQHYEKWQGKLEEYDDTDKKNYIQYMLENGGYYYVAAVTRAIFASEEGQIENINIDIVKLVMDKLNDNLLNDIFEEYKKLTVSIVNLGRKIDYNEMKKDSLYKEMFSSQSYAVFKNNIIKIIFSPAEIFEYDVLNRRGKKEVSKNELVETFGHDDQKSPTTE